MTCETKFVEMALAAPEGSEALHAAMLHLAQCTLCRNRLHELTQAGPDWWDEARQVWRSAGSDGIEIEPFLSSITSAAGPMDQLPELSIAPRTRYDSVPLEFLHPPRRADWLGSLGRYDIERVIGVGGMGIVLKALDSELHRTVAVKVLAPHLAHHASARRRFAREAQAAAAVVHPHVIPIFNVDSTATLPYLVMQYVAGPSLQTRVDQHGPLPIEVTLRIAQQTAAGLAAAHRQGLVHRDVKPANILLEGDVDRVLLSDFGLARAVDDATVSQTGIVAGTPHYMSPEQAQADAIDFRSDLFALGGVVYFMLTGRPPFRASGAMAVLHRICHESHRPVDQINPAIPSQLSHLVDHLLAKHPDQRCGSADEVERALGHLLAQWQRGEISLGNSPRTTSKGKLAVASHGAMHGFFRRHPWGVAMSVVLASVGVTQLRPWHVPTSVPRATPQSSPAPAEPRTSFDRLTTEATDREAFDQQLQSVQARLRQIAIDGDRGTSPSRVDDPFREKVDMLQRQVHSLQRE